MAFVYILRCADDTFYVGHTDDLASREDTHNAGQGSTYTAARRPVQVVYAELHPSVRSAMKREKQLKGWSAGKKRALIASERDVLKQLAKRRT